MLQWPSILSVVCVYTRQLRNQVAGYFQTMSETPLGVLGSQENGVQNNQGARSRMQK